MLIVKRTNRVRVSLSVRWGVWNIFIKACATELYITSFKTKFICSRILLWRSKEVDGNDSRQWFYFYSIFYDLCQKKCAQKCFSFHSDCAYGGFFSKELKLKVKFNFWHIILMFFKNIMFHFPFNFCILKIYSSNKTWFGRK